MTLITDRVVFILIVWKSMPKTKQANGNGIKPNRRLNKSV